MPDQSARSNLRQVLYHLRQMLPDYVDDDVAAPLLITNRHTIQLHPQANIDSDVVRLEALLTQTEQHDHVALLSCQTCYQQWAAPGGAVTALAFDAAGKRLLSGTETGMLTLRDVDSGAPLRDFEGHTSYMHRLAFRPDGQHLLSGSIDSTLRLWEVSSGEMLNRWAGHTGGVMSVAFAADGRYAASGAQDGTLMLWQVDTGDRLRLISEHEGVVHHTSFAEDGASVWSAAEDGTIRQWHLALDLEQLALWTRANHYVPEFTCERQRQVLLQPACADGE